MTTHIAGIAYDDTHAKELRFIRDVAAYSARIRMLAREAVVDPARPAMPRLAVKRPARPAPLELADRRLMVSRRIAG